MKRLLIAIGLVLLVLGAGPGGAVADTSSDPQSQQAMIDQIRAQLSSNLADALVAQSCIDHGLSLIARDTDFRHFARFGRLALAR